MTKVLRFPRPLRKVWLPLIGIASTVFILGTTVKTKSLNFIGDFETKDFSGWKQDLCCQYSGKIVNSPTRAGNYAAEFNLNRNDPLVENGMRAELKHYTMAPMGSEFWYGFSTYLPSTWAEDTAPEIITQWHDIPDFWAGEPWKRPSLTLSINSKNWAISNAWDTDFITRGNNTLNRTKLWSGSYEREKWTDWVFHIKWSHKDDGLIEAWKDGTRIVNKRGPNTYNDLLVPYLKVGIYKYPWKNNKPPSNVSNRAIYFDEIRIGNASTSYEDITPASQPTNTNFSSKLE